MFLMILFFVLSLAGAAAAAIRITPLAAAIVLGVVLCAVFYVVLVALLQLTIYLSSLAVDLSEEQNSRSPYYSFIAMQYLRIVAFFGGIRIHTTGLEQVPRDRAFLLVSNHIFDFDPLLFLLAMPWAKLGFISKKENYSMFVVNKFLHKLHCVPVDRENDRAALRSIIRTAEILREGKHSMGVFPEGYESDSGELLPFRNGVFKIAQKAEVPIVVTVLRGSKAITANLFRRRTNVEIEVLGVVQPEEIHHVLTRDVGDRIHAMMAQALERKGAV